MTSLTPLSPFSGLNIIDYTRSKSDISSALKVFKSASKIIFSYAECCSIHYKREAVMSLYCGIDLHSNKHVMVVIDVQWSSNISHSL